MEFKLKKTYITLSEFNSLVKASISSYLNEEDVPDNIPGFEFNPVAAESTFFMGLAGLVVENLDDTLFDEMFKKSAHLDLLREVHNAQKAYDTYKEAIIYACSLENILDKNLKKIINLIEARIPDEKSMKKLIDKLPKDWGKVKTEYDKIAKGELGE